MEKQIFRQKSIDRISSPEELNNYLKVSNVSIWMVLLAVAVLLTGFIVWASVGVLETKTEALIESSGEDVSVYVSGSKAELVKENMTVVIDGNEYPLGPVTYDEYGRAVSMIIANLPQGRYLGEVIIERVTPISFLFN